MSKRLLGGILCVWVVSWATATRPDTTPPNTIIQLTQPIWQYGGVNRILNGALDTSLANWSTSGANASITTDSHTGGGAMVISSGSGAYQDVLLSPDATSLTLTFWYKATINGSITAGCQILNTSNQLLVTPLSVSQSANSYIRYTADISRFKGQTIRLKFFSNTGGSAASSAMNIDDVSIREDEIVWVGGGPGLQLIVGDVVNDPIAASQVYFVSQGDDLYSPKTGPFGIPPPFDQGQTIRYRSIQTNGTSEPANETQIYHDPLPPLSCLFVSGPKSVVDGMEQVSSGGFGPTLSGWIASGDAMTTTVEKHSGTYCAKIGATGEGEIYQDIYGPLEANNSNAALTLSVWVKTVEGSGGSLSRIKILDADADDIYESDPSYSLNTILIQSTTEWTQYVWDISRFKGKFMRLKFDITAGSTFATAYVDDVSVRYGGTLYISPVSLLTVKSGELLGIDKTQYGLDSGEMQDGASFSLGLGGSHSVQYKTTDMVGQTEGSIRTTLSVDTMGPTGSIIINGDQPYTLVNSSILTIAATDSAGVAQVRLKNENNLYSDWRAYTPTLSWSLSSGGGTKTVTIQFMDKLGNLSTEYSDSIQLMFPTAVATINQAKLIGPYPKAVSLPSKRVTGIFAPNTIYVQEPDGIGGIKLNMVTAGSTGISVGHIIAVNGVIRLDANNEPEIYVLQKSSVFQPDPTLARFTRQLYIGGGEWGQFAPGPQNGKGLTMTGLLLATVGRIVFENDDGTLIRINDGSRPNDQGLLVETGDAASMVPAVGSVITITGNLGISKQGAVFEPVLRLRNSSDLQTH